MRKLPTGSTWLHRVVYQYSYHKLVRFYEKEQSVDSFTFCQKDTAIYGANLGIVISCFNFFSSLYMYLYQILLLLSSSLSLLTCTYV
jgi:hypothetical protein